MKSRAAFDASKPFVFPPLKNTSLSLSGGAFLLAIVIGVLILITSQSSTSNVSNVQHPDVQTTIVEPEQPSMKEEQTKAIKTLIETSNFPAIIILNSHIDITTATGVLGLDSGEEIEVLRKQDANYIINYQNQDYLVKHDLIDGMNLK